MTIQIRGDATILHGDCLAWLAVMPESSVDAIVTDPPYGLGFMGKGWDELPPGREFAEACLRVLRPGGHLLSFGGTRTWHRLAVAIEDAGFEMRDSVAWLYGSGFPKSLNVSKAIDKAAGATREVVGSQVLTGTARKGVGGESHGAARTNGADHVERVATTIALTAPSTPDAVKWQGWGTALKPAFEPIVVARKPLGEPTVAANVLTHGTGALNIDATRVAPTGDCRPRIAEASQETRYTDAGGTNFAALPGVRGGAPEGRWPANVLLDGDTADALDAQSAVTKSQGGSRGAGGGNGVYGVIAAQPDGYGDTGGASRFFPTFRYEAKAPTKERPKIDGVAHPTVKPLELMRWLVRLVTPPGGLVVDPFAGSGTTVEAALLEGFRVVGIEREAEYLSLIAARIDRTEGAA